MNQCGVGEAVRGKKAALVVGGDRGETVSGKFMGRIQLHLVKPWEEGPMPMHCRQRSSDGPFF